MYTRVAARQEFSLMDTTEVQYIRRSLHDAVFQRVLWDAEIDVVGQLVLFTIFWTLSDPLVPRNLSSGPKVRDPTWLTLPLTGQTRALLTLFALSYLPPAVASDGSSLQPSVPDRLRSSGRHPPLLWLASNARPPGRTAGGGHQLSRGTLRGRRTRQSRPAARSAKDPRLSDPGQLWAADEGRLPARHYPQGLRLRRAILRADQVHPPATRFMQHGTCSPFNSDPRVIIMLILLVVWDGSVMRPRYVLDIQVHFVTSPSLLSDD